MTLRSHINVIAVILILLALCGTAMATFMGLFLGTMACDAPTADGRICLAIGLGMALICMLMVTLPPVLAAMGLWRGRWKSRRLALGCAVFAMLIFPIGTALGAYMIYILWPLKETDTIFRSSAN